MPVTPVRSLVRAIFSNQRDMLNLLPESAYQLDIAELGRTRRKIILVNDPAIVRRIMSADWQDYPKNDLMVGALKPLVGDSVFVSSSDRWKRQRRLIEPAFARMQIDHSFEAMKEGVAAFQKRLDGYAESREPFSLEKAMSHLTADIVCRTIFSITLDDHISKSVFENFANFQESVADVQVLRLWLGRPWAEVRQSPKALTAAFNIRQHLGELIDARLARQDEALSDIAGDIANAADPLGGPRFNREELIDHLGVFFLAGHETTAGALAWALFILSRQPDYMSRLRAEVDQSDGYLTVETVKKLSLTRSVFRETMRLYPPLAFIPRVALNAGELGGIEFPAGAMIMISPWTLHRHEHLWPAADRFDPERFLSPKYPEGAYLPFGLGKRLCIGAAFAQIEAVLILASIAGRYDIETINEESVQPAARLTTRTTSDIIIRVRHR